MNRLRKMIAAALLMGMAVLPLPGCAQGQAQGNQQMGQLMGIALSVGAAVGSALLIKELS